MQTPASSTLTSLARAVAPLAAYWNRAALGVMEPIARRRPTDPAVHVVTAKLRGRLGDDEGRQASLALAIEHSATSTHALHGLAQLLLPGPQYTEVLTTVHEVLRPRTYLEVGVRFGATLKLGTKSDLVVGVDPAYRVGRSLARRAKLFLQTSDDFFASHERQSVLGDRFVDLAFIDGMHLFEFALRDFANIERWCHPGSTVVLHDCLPAVPVCAARQRATKFWVGDCWKAVEFLLRYRPDLKIGIVPTYPSGLVIVRGLDPSSAVIAENLPRIQQEYADWAYPYEPGRWPSHYPLIENDRAAIEHLLRSPVGEASRARTPEGSSEERVASGAAEGAS